MARILLVTWDGGGNTPPMVQTGLALRERGHDVRVLGHAAQRDGMERAGFAFTSYRQAIPWDRTAERDELQVFRVFGDAGAGRDVEAALAAWTADAVVVDCLMIGALGAAIASGLATAVLVHSFYGYFRPMVEHSPAAEIAMAHGNDPVDLWERADAVLVATDRALDVADGPVPGNVEWVGVAQPRVAAPAPRAERAHVLVSFSTVWWPDQQESMQRVLDALGGLPLRVTATIGESVESARLRVPDNVDVRTFAPHSELMPDVSAGDRPRRARDHDACARPRPSGARGPAAPDARPADHRRRAHARRRRRARPDAARGRGGPGRGALAARGRRPGGDRRAPARDGRRVRRRRAH